MRRPLNQIGQSIYDWYITKAAQDNMVALGKFAAAVLGTGTVASGLAVTPTAPASLQINVAPGEIYALAALEASAYGSLPADTTHQIVKQGIALDTQQLSCVGPTTSGYSINYLIQATFSEEDVSLDPSSGVSPVVLQFYNADNPTQPWSGPNNSGATSNTFRNGKVVLNAKAGIAAAAGSQVTPAPDAGYVGLYVVTVANGQTTINSGNIAQFSGAPIINSTLHGQAPAFSVPVVVPNATLAGHALNLGQADARYAAIGGVSNQIGELFDWPVGTTPSYGILCNGASLNSVTFAPLFPKLVRYKAGATISIASPGVIGWVGHGLSASSPVKFTTTGALPTGLVAGTTYYVIAAGLTADTCATAAQANDLNWESGQNENSNWNG